MKRQLVGELRREGSRNIIMDLSFNPEVADERMAIYFNLIKQVYCVAHES